MKSNRKTYRSTAGERKRPIRTSILELMQELSNLTSDDNLVVAAVKNIFSTHTVRLAGSPVPIRIVHNGAAARNRRKRMSLL